MLRYLKRARALAATVDRLEGEVRELKEALREVEERSSRVAERARLETLAAEQRMQGYLEQVEKAAAGLFDYVRLARTGADGRLSPDRGSP